MPLREVIENKWQPFNDIVLVTWPDNVPFKVEGMFPDGSRTVTEVTSFNYLDTLGDLGFVSIRIFDVLDEKTQLVRNLIADHMPRTTQSMSTSYSPSRIRQGSLDRRYVTDLVRGIVEAYGLVGMKPEKVDVNLPTFVTKRLPPKYHRLVKDWLGDFHGDESSYNIGNDFVERKLDNGLLAVRSYGVSGRRVILPMGHSIAYTYARQAYNQISEGGKLEYLHNSRHQVGVGEMIGRRLHVRSFGFSYNPRTAMITIGCQKVPYSALRELAKREGWDA